MSILIKTGLPALMFVALITLSSCKEEAGVGQKGHMQSSVPARVERPQQRIVTEWDEFTGRFQAMQRVELRARVSGYLDEIKFEDGEIVQKDDVLFVIDQRPFQIAMTSAKARFVLANKELKRAKTLRASKAISEEDYDQRLQEYSITKASLDEAQLNLEFTEVKAPFTGRISRNRVDVGSLISGGASATLLTVLVTTSPIELYFEGSEGDLLHYLRTRKKTEEGKSETHPVFAKLQDESDFVHNGEINFLDNELAFDTGTIQVRAIFDNEDDLLRPGLFARLRIAINEPAEVILVSPNVIGTEQTRKYIYTLDQGNKAVRTYITLGGLTEDGLRIVKSGLAAQDRIIVGGLHMVQPGVEIAPIESVDAEQE